MTRLRSLSGAAAFRRVRDEGRRARRDGVTVYAAPAPPGSGVRLGLAVGRRVGSATTRNLVKRRLRAAVDAAAPDGDVDLVITATPEVTAVPYRALEEAVRTSLRRTAGVQQ